MLSREDVTSGGYMDAFLTEKSILSDPPSEHAGARLVFLDTKCILRKGEALIVSSLLRHSLGGRACTAAVLVEHATRVAAIERTRATSPSVEPVGQGSAATWAFNCCGRGTRVHDAVYMYASLLRSKRSGDTVVCE